jgi:hypothetical protein
MHNGIEEIMYLECSPKKKMDLNSAHVGTFARSEEYGKTKRTLV